MLGMQSPSSPTLIDAFEPPRRKRKAESHDNDRERLSKRLSRLNIGESFVFLVLFSVIFLLSLVQCSWQFPFRGGQFGLHMRPSPDR